jgi:hypothetical protein
MQRLSKPNRLAIVGPPLDIINKGNRNGYPVRLDREVQVNPRNHPL